MAAAASGGDDGVTFPYTAKAFLVTGLLMFYTEARIKRVKTTTTNPQRFIDHFGRSHLSSADLWKDTQTTSVVKAKISPKSKKEVFYFLTALHFLKCYLEENQRESRPDKSQKTLRDWGRYYIERVRAMKKQVIYWPVNNVGSNVWTVSVDGTQGRAYERIHPTMSKDPKMFSHKFHGAGYNYELGIALHESKLVWMVGSPGASETDLDIFRA